MSHIASGFCVKDIEALALTVKAQCPELELVRQKTYRTWIADTGSLVGDYPLPGIYQLKLVAALIRQGVDVHGKAKACGVELPTNVLELEHKSWTLEQQRKLLHDPTIKKAYEQLVKDVVGKDAEFVIRYKDGKHPEAYEVGLVPHPVHKGEYVMMTDFYAQGNGLLNAKGLGKHIRTNKGDSWGGELKQAYSVRATERVIQKEMAAGNPEYGSVKKVTLPDGRVQLEIEPRPGA